MEMVPRISRAQKMDALSSMANIAGYRAVIEAGNNFPRFFTGQITAAGKVPPAKVLVVGAGVAGLAAIGTSTSLGAITYAFDVRPEVAEQVESMGAEFVFLDFEEEQADGAATGGYAAVSSPEFAAAQLAKFREIAPDMDIVITTALIPNREAPELWTKDMVESMKPGSVIVDLAAEKGGNCKLTVMDEKIVTDNGVTIIGYTDFPSRMAAQASTLYATNIRHMMTDLTPEKDGQINHDMEDDVIRGATVTFDKEITFPPPPPKVQAIAAKPKEVIPELTPEEKRAAETAAFKAQTKQQVTLLTLVRAFVGCWSRCPCKLYAALYRFCSVGLCGLPSYLGRGAQLAHTADGGDECDLVDHHSGRADANRFRLILGDPARSCVDLYDRHQHIWRLSCNTAHARHVPEILRGLDQWNLVLQQQLTWFAAVLFILSLGGLSGQESAKRAVWYGIVGMALAVAATLVGPVRATGYCRILMIIGGGAIGYQLATKVQMTQMPELVAAMHSLVGLAAVFVGLIAHIELGACLAMDDAGKKALEGFAALAGQERRRRDRHSAG